MLHKTLLVYNFCQENSCRAAGLSSPKLFELSLLNIVLLFNNKYVDINWIERTLANKRIAS